MGIEHNLYSASFHGSCSIFQVTIIFDYASVLTLFQINMVFNLTLYGLLHRNGQYKKIIIMITRAVLVAKQRVGLPSEPLI